MRGSSHHIRQSNRSLPQRGVNLEFMQNSKQKPLEIFFEIEEDFNFSMLPVLILLLVFFMVSSEGTPFPIAKPGCDDHCGNVSIPFPFGTKEGCYLRKGGFFIECLNSSNQAEPPRPVLWGSPFNVTDISLEGQLRIMNYVTYNCYSGNKSYKFNSPWIDVAMPLIFNDTANKFTVIGCDTYAFVRGASNLRRYNTGCMSACDKKEDVEDGSCSGFGCCQTSIPTGAWQINVTLRSFNNHSLVSSFDPCSYAFVVESKAFHFFADNLTNLDRVVSLPVVVDWVIEYETCEEAQKNLSSFACFENSVCYDPVGALGYRCKCKDGYDGNPYLPNSCQDIDECANPNLNNCAQYSTCNNTVGNYTCHCLQGYHGDGRKGGQGCIADEKPNKKNSWPIIAGVGISTGTVIIPLLSFCLYFEWMRRKANKLREEFFRKNGGLLLQEKLARQGGGQYAARIFSIEELQKATNDFDESQIIGRGGFGTVFKGALTNNKEVAIKKSRGVNEFQVEQFINEVIVLSQINNRNVVKLLGCCLETEVPLLVYEFIDNGTLSEHLHNNIKASKLSWNIRLRIASEVGGVLSYLHSVASPPIIHRDIKSANILLDKHYTAKLSDFGTSRLVPTDENQVTTMVKGTQGYLDPEYMQTGVLTEKSDVYSFGVVLMELLTGKKVLSFDKPEGERFLSYQFLSALKDDHLVEILDNNISCHENIEQLKKVAMIAKNCINVKGDDRPYMRDVARELAVLEIIAKEIAVEIFETAATEFKDDMQSKEYRSSDDCFSSDLYPLCHSVTPTRFNPGYPCLGVDER